MAAIGAGVLGLLCLSSSAYAAMNRGVGEETPAQLVVVPDTETETETKAEADAGSIPTSTSTGDTKGQYVRLWQGNPYQSQDAYALNILELEVYDSSGVNIAKDKSATARSQYSGDHKAVSAFDGSLDTKYHSNHDNKEDWLEVDLGSVIDIHKIVIRHPDNEDVYKGVAVKDRLRGYIEIFNGDKTTAKTEQIEETSTDHVYTYNFKERGGGKWRGGQGILRTRSDIISENQAAEAAAADAEQKRLASKAVVEKAAADKAAADKAVADKAAADKAAADKAAADKAAADKALADARAAQAAAEARANAAEAARAAEVKARADAAAEAERVRLANMSFHEKVGAGMYPTFAGCYAAGSAYNDGEGSGAEKFACCESSRVPYPEYGETGYLYCNRHT